MPIQPKTKQCHFCFSNIKYVDYKNSELLKRYLTPQSKIQSRRKSSLCAKHQRLLANAIKKARILGLVAFTPK